MTQRQTHFGNAHRYEEQIISHNVVEGELLVAYNKWLPMRKECIQRLNNLAVNLNKVRSETNEVSLFGSGASTIGGVAVIVGLVLAPVTLGLSAGLTAGGAICSVVGSGASIASNLKDMEITKDACNEIQKLLKKDKENTDELLRLIPYFDELKQQVLDFIRTTPFTDEDLRDIAKRTTRLCKKTQLGAWTILVISGTMGMFLKIAPYLKDVFGEVTTSYLTTASTMATNLLKAPALLSVTTRIGLGVAVGSSVALDIWTMVSILDDMEKGSKSETAKKFIEMAGSLEHGLNTMEKGMDGWQETYRRA